MPYSAEVIARARRRLESARADRESENQEHLRIAYTQVPRIKEIDLLLRRSMALAAQAVFTQGGDAQLAMEQVKQANLALQQERRELELAHLGEGYLDDSPLCPNCGGSGYVGTQMCECLQELCRQEQKKELALLTGTDDRFEKFRLDYYSSDYNPAIGTDPRTLMEKNLRACREYATRFGPGSGNLLFFGNTGQGKTFLSACIARTVTERGYYVVYETAANLFLKLEKNRFSPTPETQAQTDRLLDADLLIIDDLGTELPSQFVIAALYSLLNDRLLAGKSMLISTNLTLTQLEQRYSPQIASRLRGSFDMRTFAGEDIRIKKSRGY